MTDSHKERLAGITEYYRDEITVELQKLGFTVMPNDEVAALRAELAAANAKVAERKVITEREEVLFALLFSTSGHRWLRQEAENQEMSITLNKFFINEIKEAFAIAVESDGFVEINEETVAAVFHDITGGDFAEFMKGEGWPQ